MAARNILVIDDDKDNRTLVKFALELNTDWTVSMAKDGTEGITKAKSQCPDLILLDLAMPELDGLTVCEVLKYDLFTCTIPIIFITACVEEKVLALLKNTLAEDVVTKPFDIYELESQISEIISLK